MRLLKAGISLGMIFTFSILADQVSGETNIQGQILQMARETVYIDLGRKDGLVVGQVLQVLHEEKKVAELRVVRLGDGFAACERVSGTVVLKVSDRVIGQVLVAIPDSVRVTEGEKEIVPIVVVPQKGQTVDASAVDSDPPKLKTKVRGKIALRYSLLNDQSDLNRDVHQPAGVFVLNVDQIGGTPLAFSFRMRARHYLVRNAQQTQITHPNFRLYDMALTFDSQQNRYGFGLGRLNPSMIAGVGEFDGALFTARLGQGLQLGVFGGFQPNWETSSFETNTSKTGVFVHFQNDHVGSFTQSATLAFAGQYQNGVVEREFIYGQHTIQIGRHVYVYQYAEFDLDRTDRSARMKTLQMTNVFSSLRYSPSRLWSVGVGYDARKYLPLEDVVLDSLLDTAFRQGWRADLSVRPYPKLYLYARSNLQLRAGERSTKALAVGGILSKMPLLDTTLRSRVTLVTGEYNQATDFNFGVGRNLGRSLYADVAWGRYRSHLLTPDTWQTRNHFSGNVQVYLPRRSYLTLSHDLYRGEIPYSYTFLELGMRF